MEDTLSLLAEYKYALLFPLSIVEGPVITIVAGILCQAGLMKLIYVVPVLVAGDMIGDSFYYALGRWSNRPLFRKLAPRIGISGTAVAAAQNSFIRNPVRAILFSKIFPGVGVVGLVVAGSAGFSFKRFLIRCIPVTMGQAVVYLLTGFFFGQLYASISTWMNWFASASITVFLLVILVNILRSLKKTT